MAWVSYAIAGSCAHFSFRFTPDLRHPRPPQCWLSCYWTNYQTFRKSQKSQATENSASSTANANCSVEVCLLVAICTHCSVCGPAGRADSIRSLFYELHLLLCNAILCFSGYSGIFWLLRNLLSGRRIFGLRRCWPGSMFAPISWQLALLLCNLAAICRTRSSNCPMWFSGRW